MATEVIDYRPPPTVARFLQSDALVAALQGPFGSGKSVGCVMALVKRAMEQEPDTSGVRHTRFAIIRNTYKMLQDTTIKTVFEWLPQGVAGTYLSTKNIYTLDFQLGDGTRLKSEWLFRALDTADDAKNLLSLELTGAWVNEYRDINSDVFINLLGRVGRYPSPKTVRPTWFGVIMDTNPPSTSSFWYKFFEEGVSAEVAQVLEDLGGDRELAEIFKQPSGLSPEAENIENLPPNYYATLMALNQDKSPEWVKVHVHGEYGYVQDGLPVYPEFNGRVHVARETLKPVPGKPIAIGMDFGLTPAAVFCQQNAKGQWLILGELVTPLGHTQGIEKFIEKLWPYLRQRFPEHNDFEVWGDPAGNIRSQSDEKTCFQALRAAGFKVFPGAKDLETRLGSVRRALNRMVEGEPGLLMDPGAKTLLRGFHGEYKYRRVQGRDEKYTEQPDKNEVSHVHDGLQHLMGAYEGPGLAGRPTRSFGKGRVSKPIVNKPTWRVFG